MAEIIEILFENVAFNEASNFLTELSFRSDIKNIQIVLGDGYSLKDKNSTLLDIGSYFEKCTGGAIHVDIQNVEISNHVLPKVAVQIYKYTNTYDLSIDVDYQELQGLISLKSLQKWASEVSHRLNSESYFCGLEPASDEDTRFFTNDKLGPLEFNRELT